MPDRPNYVQILRLRFMSLNMLYDENSNRGIMQYRIHNGLKRICRAIFSMWVEDLLNVSLI